MQNVLLVAARRGFAAWPEYDFRTDWTGSTAGKTKLNLDDFLIARPGGRPTAAGLTLRTLGLFVFPINREIG